MTAVATGRGRLLGATTRSAAARDLARSKVMAIRFVAHLSALGPARRLGLATRLREAERERATAAARAEVHAAAVDPTVVGSDVDVVPFLASLALLTRDAVGGGGSDAEATLASSADDVVRALLIHTHPAYEADFQRLYAPFAADIGFDRLLLG